MKNRRIRIALTAIVIALFASAFAACNVYEHEEIEIRRCPQVQDTVIIPGWDETE
ncbi:MULTISPECIES: hypothetical protein [Alistipes]|uniref:hypothetical protein n=1 Tax=Alistipes TaxID=239759 RepID=UPI0013ED1796|nr:MULTISPECIES: hypothetical protein [Alistipes]MBR2218488.1 hypothetical protein [Alistipes sp.]